MTDKYKELFTELAHTSELLAEHVMEYDHGKNDDKGEQTAQKMRDDFRTLGDKLKAGETLERADYARLLVGAYTAMNSIEARIKMYQAAVSGYKVDLIPKLSRILNETKTEEEVNSLANELFAENPEN
jgi:hypothetical protein